MKSYSYNGKIITASSKEEAIQKIVAGFSEKYKKIKLINPKGKETVFREVDLKKVDKDSRSIEAVFVDSKGKKTTISPTTPWEFPGMSKYEIESKAFEFIFSDGTSIYLTDKNITKIYDKLNAIIKAN